MKISQLIHQMSTIKLILKILLFPFGAIAFCILSALGFLYDVFWEMTTKEVFIRLGGIFREILFLIFHIIFYIPCFFIRSNNGWDRSLYSASTIAVFAFKKYDRNIKFIKYLLKDDELAEYKWLIKQYPEGYSQYKKLKEEEQKIEEAEEKEKRKQEEEQRTLNTEEYKHYLDSLNSPYIEEELDKYLDSQINTSLDTPTPF